VALDGTAFRALLRALVLVLEKVQALDRAEELLLRMADYGVSPEPAAWCAVMDADDTNRGLARASRLYNAWRLNANPSSSSSSRRRRGKAADAAAAGAVVPDGAQLVLESALRGMARCPDHAPEERWQATRPLLHDARALGLDRGLSALAAASVGALWLFDGTPDSDPELLLGVLASASVPVPVPPSLSGFGRVGVEVVAQDAAWARLLEEVAKGGRGAWALQQRCLGGLGSYLEASARARAAAGLVAEQQHTALSRCLDAAIQTCRESYWAGTASKEEVSSLLQPLLARGVAVDPQLVPALQEFGVSPPEKSAAGQQRWRKKQTS
jgi:hypothetical protein